MELKEDGIPDGRRISCGGADGKSQKSVEIISEQDEAALYHMDVTDSSLKASKPPGISSQDIEVTKLEFKPDADSEKEKKSREEMLNPKGAESQDDLENDSNNLDGPEISLDDLTVQDLTSYTDKSLKL